MNQRAAGGRPRKGGLLHSSDSRRSHSPSWYRETSTIEPPAGRTASHREQRNLYLLMLGVEAEFHRTRRAVPQTHFTSVRRVPCFKSLHYTCPSVQVEGGGRVGCAGAQPDSPKPRNRTFYRLTVTQRGSREVWRPHLSRGSRVSGSGLA